MAEIFLRTAATAQAEVFGAAAVHADDPEQAEARNSADQLAGNSPVNHRPRADVRVRELDYPADRDESEVSRHAGREHVPLH